MRISEIMNPKPSRCGPDAPFEKLLKTMKSLNSRLLYVTEGDNLLGVISNYDVLKVMLPFYVDSNLARAISLDEDFARRMLMENKRLRAQDIMVKQCITLSPESHLLEAEAMFKEKAVNALAVTDASGHLVGELTRKAVLGKLIELCGQAMQER